MKFMNMKRIASTAMAGVLTLSLAVPAFATNTTVITGTYQDIEIAVEVPTTGEAQINPYGLPVDIAKSDKSVATISDQKITTQPMSIKNQGTTPLDVNASLLVAPAGDVSIVANSATEPTDKSIQVSLDVVGLNDSALAVAAGNTLEDLLIDRFVNDATWDSANQLHAPAYAKGATTAPAAAKSASALASLGTATVNGKTITYSAKSIALVRLSGKVAESPVDASSNETPWTDADGFEATVVFSFKPTPKTEVAVSVTGGGASAVTVAPPTTLKGFEGDTITCTFEAPSGKVCTAAVTGMDGAAPTVDVTEEGTTGKFTVTFTMPKDDATPGISLAITVPA